jgi:hypothetical protein
MLPPSMAALQPAAARFEDETLEVSFDAARA